MSFNSIDNAERFALFESLINFSNDAIITKTLDGAITSWNKSVEELFGYTSEEIVGKNVSVIIPADRVSEESEIIGKIKAGENIRHCQTVRLRKDGSKIDISLTVSPRSTTPMTRYGWWMWHVIS